MKGCQTSEWVIVNPLAGAGSKAYKRTYLMRGCVVEEGGFTMVVQSWGEGLC